MTEKYLETNGIYKAKQLSRSWQAAPNSLMEFIEGMQTASLLYLRALPGRSSLVVLHGSLVTPRQVLMLIAQGIYPVQNNYFSLLASHNSTMVKTHMNTLKFFQVLVQRE